MTTAAGAQELALVIDFGGQYTQLIVRRCRDLGVYSEMVPWDSAGEQISKKQPKAVILSGGPESTLAPGAPGFDFSLVEGIPLLGICYGAQLMAKDLGGNVEKSTDREYGAQTLDILEPAGLLGSLPDPNVWMSHGDRVLAPPAGWRVTATTRGCPIAAMEGDGRFAVQFHPEVSHTPAGRELLRAFLYEHAGFIGEWTTENFIEAQTDAIREKVGDQRVLCAVSGGVDSTVVAALLTQAIGDQVTCVFVDHGLLRKGEVEQVHETFTRVFHPRLVVIDAADRFFAALAGVTDPEQKRKIIGAEFIACFDEHVEEIGHHDWLAQGTLYPDVIESGSSTARTIKTHHNVGGLPDVMKLKVLEPMRMLFKDEVRQVGRALGLPDEVVEREPFPGPGLAVRILGEITPERVRMVQEADAIFRDALRENGLNKGVWQSYAALLDVRSVGVMGDERTYEQPIVLRAVRSEDAMTADAVEFPHAFLTDVATQIVNKVAGVNRVLYDLTSKPPATIEWE